VYTAKYWDIANRNAAKGFKTLNTAMTTTARPTGPRSTPQAITPTPPPTKPIMMS
jgi:hypothetical protein